MTVSRTFGVKWSATTTTAATATTNQPPVTISPDAEQLLYTSHLVGRMEFPVFARYMSEAWEIYYKQPTSIGAGAGLMQWIAPVPCKDITTLSKEAQAKVKKLGDFDVWCDGKRFCFFRKAQFYVAWSNLGGFSLVMANFVIRETLIAEFALQMAIRNELKAEVTTGIQPYWVRDEVVFPQR